MTEPIQSGGKAVPEGKTMSRQQRWAMNNPLAVWAHAAVRSALKRGLITRGPCEVCGDETTDAHHDDYSRPLVVRWLCRRHHKAEHAKPIEGGVVPTK